MSLSSEQINARDGKLTASRIGVLMNGDPEKILALWEEMTGQREPEDLSDVWAVQLGSHTESLNLAWYERRTGRKLIRHGEVVICPSADWAACTLDAFDLEIYAPVEAKHVGGYEPREKVIERYQPQLHWQMMCTETHKAAISIIEGAREPVVEIVELNEAYAAELWSRAEQFMQCVSNLVQPVALLPISPPVPQEQWLTVDMTESNEWANFAVDWLTNRDAAKTFEKAAKEIKAMVKPNVGLATGYGVQCKRFKAGSLTISPAKG